MATERYEIESPSERVAALDLACSRPSRQACLVGINRFEFRTAMNRDRTSPWFAAIPGFTRLVIQGRKTSYLWSKSPTRPSRDRGEKCLSFARSGSLSTGS